MIKNERETLFDIFNDINITMINNNLSIKDKLIKKINIIKTLSNSNVNVLNYNNDKKNNLFNILISINNKLMSVQKKHNKLTSKLNNILGIIIHNAYISTGYQVLLSNIPTLAHQISDDKISITDVETIYDTILHYSGKNTVLNVIKVDTDKYLVKFKDINDARKLCKLIHKMMIEPNIIKAEMLETIETYDNETHDKETYEMCHDFNTLYDLECKNKNSNSNGNSNSNYDYDDTVCDYGVGKFSHDSLFRLCIDLAYIKYKNIQEKIKKNINYILSFLL
jgi:hypothetical protein